MIVGIKGRCRLEGEFVTNPAILAAIQDMASAIREIIEEIIKRMQKIEF